MMTDPAGHTTIEICKDDRIEAHVGRRVLAAQGGLQPFLFCSDKGTLVLHVQLPEEPLGTRPVLFPSRMATFISRDEGQTWQRFVHDAAKDDVNLEGGVVQLSDGSIVMLDTYVLPGDAPDTGVGELWRSHDDWWTLEGPSYVRFDLPRINFDASTDDTGRSHRAARLHRSFLETPNGDLLLTMYSWLKGDAAPAAYMPTMMKTRAMLLRSQDKGQTWHYDSTIAADTGVGTEGFTEPVLVRVSRPGRHQGRLICLMRTGRELYEAHSDDNGATWSTHKAVHLPGIDIYDIPSWEDRFAGQPDSFREKYPMMIGAVVDPDLIEMRNGVLACAFGVRIPEKACWVDPGYARNGNYLAFSLDQGETWSHIIQLTSGIMTTPYMAVREMRPGELYVVYDVGAWGRPGRATYGCKVEVTLRGSGVP